MAPNVFRSIALFGLVMSSTFIGCKHAPIAAAEPTVSPKKQAERKAADTAAEEIRNLVLSGSFEAAVIKASRFEKKYTLSPLLPEIHALHGQALLGSKRSAAAVFQLKKALQLMQNLETRPKVLLLLSQAYFQTKLLDDAMQTLSEIQPNSLEVQSQIKYYELREEIMRAQNLWAEAARELLTLSLITQPEYLRARLVDDLKTIDSPNTLEGLFREFPESPLGDYLLFKISELETAKERSAEAKERLKQLRERFPQSPYLAENATLATASPTSIPQEQNNQNATQGLLQGVSGKIGVLLPLTGRFSKYGQRALQSLLLATDVFNSTTASPIELAVEDAGEDPSTAIRALEKLSKVDQVSFVVGPLMSKGIEAVTEKANELQIPLITLTQQSGSNRDWTFSGGLTTTLQAQAMAKYAVQKLGIKKFAILYPQTKTGEASAHAFWEAAEKLNAEIRAFESYSEAETDFRKQIDKMVGLAQPEWRQRELDELAKLRLTDKISKRTRKTEKYFALPPRIDFDAVFIPDDPKSISLSIPTFSYRDVDHVIFLGINSWNSQETVSRLQKNSNGLLFPDLFFLPATDKPEGTTSKFIQAYQNEFAEMPGSIEAVAYDIGILCKWIVQQPEANSRLGVKTLLSTDHSVGSGLLSQKINLGENQIQRPLTVLTINNQTVMEHVLAE